LSELHTADIGHCQPPLESGKDYVVERDVVFFFFG
jgi:hypothetical protein